MRANTLVYYALTSTATDVIFFWRGLYTLNVAIYALNFFINASEISKLA